MYTRKVSRKVFEEEEEVVWQGV